MRSILRQDPDVVFVCEMRDEEVLQIAIKAALTVHLVLSTLHRSGAADSMLRLVDLGIRPYLLANALVMIIAQRLACRVCDGCGEDYVPTDHELRLARLERERVYEVLRVPDDIREIVRKSASAGGITACGKQHGFRTLVDSGLAAARASETARRRSPRSPSTRHPPRAPDCGHPSRLHVGS